MTYYAALMLDADPAARGRAVSAAKVQVGKALRHVGQEAIQIHGGIGMTNELAVGWYFKRGTVLESLYGDVDHQTLVQIRIHGVSADFVRKLRTLGYDDVAADQLITMRVHGVTPEFIRRVEAAGYHRVPIEKLVQMRIFDIDPEMVGALDDDGR